MKNKKIRVLLLQPQQEDSQEVIELIRVALASEYSNVIIETIGDLQYIYKSSTTSIIEAVSIADLIIGNMDGANQSVTVGLGIAISKEKPIVLISSVGKALSISKELLAIPLFIFDFDQKELFLNIFGSKVSDILNPEEKDNFENRKNSIFISYSHADKEFLNRLLVHLKPLQRQGLIKVWSDTDIKAGDRWKQEIENALNNAGAAILLVSADFMASDFIVTNELPPLLLKAQSEGTRILSLIVKPCRFTRDEHLSSFQAMNDPRKPLISLSEAEAEETYDRVAKTVEEIANR